MRFTRWTFQAENAVVGMENAVHEMNTEVHKLKNAVSGIVPAEMQVRLVLVVARIVDDGGQLVFRQFLKQKQQR